VPGVLPTIVLAVFAGGAVGSFAGVVAARGWRDSLGGRSRCDACLRELRWFELVPLLSYPLLRGRCRSCGAGIGLPVYAWELGGAVLAGGVAALALALSGAL
jgi:leader peptidase (prepilin peptidase) / N-methyltransferase